ncbi:SDR family NAD(P)-dependent oxidoreductase [Ornithinibacillus californiensis]|uniref:SDR family NAD(P)-dependent oxidoreductase n=1 Tax=Ornithinibacillus californiensis TaxID=161536 RepID=UPI00064DAEAA|nr:SDR family NAD(P)-dependent oxidoreductase [Ornithinibacillus californiensis]
MRVALVTGANGGFGKLIVMELLKANYFVVAAMRTETNKDELLEMVKQLDLEERIFVAEMDVTKEEQVKQASQWVQNRFNKLDVLINNAGYSQGGFTTDLTILDWQKQYDTNVLGVIQTTSNFLPLLKNSKKGQIINLSSVSGYFGFPGMGPYCSSKFALEGYSESLRLELISEGIYVSLIEPASFKTGIWEKGLEIGAVIHDDTLKKNALAFAKQSFQNAGDPLEVAKVIVKVCKSNRPKFRYRVGKGANSLWFIKKFVPWSIIERTVTKKLSK